MLDREKKMKYCSEHEKHGFWTVIKREIFNEMGHHSHFRN